MEYITQAASSYAFIFCFCNLIIVIILVDLKPKLSFNQGSEEIPLSLITNKGIEAAKSKCLVSKSTLTPQAREVAHVKEEVVVDRVEMEGKDNCNCNSTEEDDELRRRVEEFIERVNEGWKAEHFNSSSLLWGENNNNKELLE